MVTRAAPPWAPLLPLVEAAGREILRHYRVETRVDRKADDSPVTAADRAAHGLLVAGLRDLADAPVISEEGRLPTFEERRAWRRFWLVDPLDGTKEFVRGDDDFTVNVALIEDGVPVLGVVAAPALGQTYVAAVGDGAWRLDAGAEPIRLLWRDPPPGTPLRVVVSRSHPSAALDAYLTTLAVAERIPVGSSLKFCRVAEGRADLYARLGPTMEWDVAAGDCIWRHARALGANPSELRYNGADLRNPPFAIGAHVWAGSPPPAEGA